MFIYDEILDSSIVELNIAALIEVAQWEVMRLFQFNNMHNLNITRKIDNIVMITQRTIIINDFFKN